MGPVAQTVAMLAVVVVAGLTVSMAGWAELIITGLLSLLAVVRFAIGSRTIDRAAQLSATLGGIVGVFTAGGALLQVGGLPIYSSRASFGAAALVLAALATLGSTQASQRPWLAALGMLLCSTLGFLCINLLYINTFYFVSLLLFWAASVLALVVSRTHAAKTAGQA